MLGSWWVGEEELDTDQQEVITLPLEGSNLVIGPPGSGKTNLLLLRANYLYLAGYKNILILVFTNTLQRFIVSGGNVYSFPTSKIQTCHFWECDLLRQYGIPFDLPEVFNEQRMYLIEKIRSLVEERQLSKIFDCILIDEAQDYLPEEIKLFNKLSKYVFAVADSRQQIYDVGDSVKTLYEVFGEPKRLHFHYRNGLKICKLADGIAKDIDKYESLSDSSNYDEDAYPSSVESYRCRDIEDQAIRIIRKLDLQLKAYPEELIGIVSPRRQEALQIWEYISTSAYGPYSVLQLGSESEYFDQAKPIFVSTFHGIKGLEVRSLHMAGCNHLKKFPYNRNMAYTAITRTKTSLTIYYDDDIHGYLESALANLTMPPELPTLQDVFGGER